jgi:hypothetical protein
MSKIEQRAELIRMVYDMPPDVRQAFLVLVKWSMARRRAK